MPIIGERYYANAAYGRALEQARAADRREGRSAATKGQPTRSETEDATSVGNIVHNETGGLRPTTQQGPGSEHDLHEAKVAIAQVIENRRRSEIFGGVASSRVRSKEKTTSQYRDAQKAASEAEGNNSARGATHFYLHYDGDKLPKWSVGKNPVATYGPFVNAAGHGDVPKNAKVTIVVFQLEPRN